MKRINPTWITRMKAGAGAGAKLFGGSFGTIATLTGLLNAAQMVVPWEISILYGGSLSFILGLARAFWKGKVSHIPDMFIDGPNSESPYLAEFCTGEKLAEACELTKPYYGSEYVPPDRAEQWRLRNPKAFVDILNSEGVLCASFGILALEKSFLQQFLDGKVSDTQMHAEDICSFSESRRSAHLYISGVVVREATSLLGPKRAKVMIWAMLKYVRKFYGTKRSRKLYAVAVNSQSDRILKALDFKLLAAKRERRDKCNLYTYVLDQTTWETLLLKVGDHSKLCTLNF